MPVPAVMAVVFGGVQNRMAGLALIKTPSKIIVIGLQRERDRGML